VSISYLCWITHNLALCVPGSLNLDFWLVMNHDCFTNDKGTTSISRRYMSTMKSYNKFCNSSGQMRWGNLWCSFPMGFKMQYESFPQRQFGDLESCPMWKLLSKSTNQQNTQVNKTGALSSYQHSPTSIIQKNLTLNPHIWETYKINFATLGHLWSSGVK
jgi:hypothetical protein